MNRNKNTGITILLFLIPGLIIACQANAQSLLNSKDINTLKATLEYKNIAGLGEEAHGYESINQVKSAVASLMHDSFHFTHLVFESSFVAAVTAYYMQQNPVLRIRQSLYPFWTTPAVLKVYSIFIEEEKEENSIHIAGCDLQEDFRFRTFSSFLIASGIIRQHKEDLLKADSLLAKYIGYEAGDKKVMPPGELLQLQHYYSAIGVEAAQQTTDIQKQALLQRCFVNRIWLCEYLGIKSISKRMAMRDSLMAQNVKWLQENVFNMQKLIVWTTDLHVKKPEGDHTSWMGEYLFQYFRDQYAAISVIHKKGIDTVRLDPVKKGNTFDLLIYAGSKEKIEDKYWITPRD